MVLWALRVLAALVKWMVLAKRKDARRQDSPLFNGDSALESLS